MQISQLTAFLSVAELQSFSGAAEKLHLTQPAISKRIKQLEQQLNTALFDRIGKKCLLTPAGENLIPHARRILLEIREYKTQLSNQSDTPCGILSLATSHHIGLHRLPPVLRQFKNDYPAVDLDLHFMDSEDACAAVASNKIALAIVTLPTHPQAALKLQTIWQDNLTLVLANDHPLNQHAIINKSQLLDYPAILPSSNTFTRELIDQYFADKPPEDVILETNYLETIKVMVSVNLGWSILPASMVDESITSASLKGLNLKRELGLVTAQHRSLANNAQAMINSLQSAI